MSNPKHKYTLTICSGTYSVRHPSVVVLADAANSEGVEPHRARFLFHTDGEQTAYYSDVLSCIREPNPKYKAPTKTEAELAAKVAADKQAHVDLKNLKEENEVLAQSLKKAHERTEMVKKLLDERSNVILKAISAVHENDSFGCRRHGLYLLKKVLAS